MTRTSNRPAGWFSRLRSVILAKVPPAIASRLPPPVTLVRYWLARRYLIGTGLEIGALHFPLRVSRRATVRYVDRMGVAELREHYPELAPYDLVEPDIIDDAQLLPTVASASVDFIIANQVVEHYEDPVTALETYARTLRPGGILYMAVPDKRVTFDRDRPVTSVAHIISDRMHGPAASRHMHFQEWARLVTHVGEADVEAHAEELERQDYSIHFHTFVPASFIELISECRRQFALDLAIEELVRWGNEFIVVMRKSSPAG